MVRTMPRFEDKGKRGNDFSAIKYVFVESMVVIAS